MIEEGDQVQIITSDHREGKVLAVRGNRAWVQWNDGNGASDIVDLNLLRKVKP